jgi:hypothetical protein
MSKFDEIYNQVLNEGIGDMFKAVGSGVGTAASGLSKVGSAIGAGIKAAENPMQGVKTLVQGLAKSKEEKEAREKEPISAKNKAKRGEKVWCITRIFQITPRVNEDGSPMLDAAGKPMMGWAAQEYRLNGSALTESDARGNFQVQIPDPYVFFKYNSYNKSGVQTIMNVVGISGKLPAGIDGKNVGIVGPTITGLDQGLKTWYILSGKEEKEGT